MLLSNQTQGDGMACTGGLTPLDSGGHGGVTAEDGHRPVNSDQKRERPKVLHLIGKQTDPPQGTTGTEQIQQPQVIAFDDLRLLYL